MTGIKNRKNKNMLNPHISVDCVIFGFDYEKLNVLVIRRDTGTKSAGMRMALPGDLIYDNECLDTAANRVLKELTGVDGIFLEQVAAFGNPNRSKTKRDQKWLKTIRDEPQARVVTIGYFALVPMKKCELSASSFARTAEWVAMEDIEELAFDHMDILQTAFNKLKEKLNTRPIGFNLLPEKFTLGQLHKLYEAILEKKIDKRNFRRKILKLGIITTLKEKQKGVAHKPSHYVKFNKSHYSKLSKTGFDNFAF